MNTDLLFENARLQGRVITLEALLESERAEVARLKAEVERLTALLNTFNKPAEAGAEIMLTRIEDTVKELRAEFEAAKEVQS